MSRILLWPVTKKDFFFALVALRSDQQGGGLTSGAEGWQQLLARGVLMTWCGGNFLARKSKKRCSRGTTGHELAGAADRLGPHRLRQAMFVSFVGTDFFWNTGLYCFLFSFMVFFSLKIRGLRSKNTEQETSTS